MFARIEVRYLRYTDVMEVFTDQTHPVTKHCPGHRCRNTHGKYHRLSAIPKHEMQAWCSRGYVQPRISDEKLQKSYAHIQPLEYHRITNNGVQVALKWSCTFQHQFFHIVTNLITLWRPCVKSCRLSAAVGLGGSRGFAGKYTNVRINKAAATENSVK